MKVKFEELYGVEAPAQRERYEEIRRGFAEKFGE